MWILFGTNHDTIENEPAAYFVGVFEDFDLANDEKKKLIIENKSDRYDYFIQYAEINSIYDYFWSNNSDLKSHYS